jgi:hypothetical protein
VLVLARLELAAVVLALVLEHLDPAFALAAILALAVVVGGLQAPLPAQPLTPKHRPGMPSTATADAISAVPDTTIAAAVMAILAPDFWLSFILLSYA